MKILSFSFNNAIRSMSTASVSAIDVSDVVIGTMITDDALTTISVQQDLVLSDMLDSSQYDIKPIIFSESSVVAPEPISPTIFCII